MGDVDDPTSFPERRIQTPTKITDVDMDSLVQCSRYLNLKDISNLAMSSKYLRTVAYSDPIWHRLSRDQWPKEVVSSFPKTSSAREAYLARHTAVQQLKFVDPLVMDFYTEAFSYNFLHISKDDVIFSEGSAIQMMRINNFLKGDDFLVTLCDHRGRVTSMLLCPVDGTFLDRSGTLRNEDVLLTSSRDHSIRLWWKGNCRRCFRGHNGPVSTLSNKLLDDGSVKIFASGGEDGTVRLWSLSSGGKRGQHALKATLYGHEKPIVLMSVAGHRSSLLVSMSKDSKMRVWDTTVSSSSIRSACCVGMKSVPGAPVGIRCHESLVYVGAGSSVVAIDLRTMQKVHTISIHQSELQSFQIMPSEFLICTGGINRAMLWDIRKNSVRPNTGSVAELDGHTGAVKNLHMDMYKIVTASPTDQYINIWDPNTGTPTNTLPCHPNLVSSQGRGCSALAVNGCQIVTGSWSEEDEEGRISYRNFTNATCPVSSGDDKLDSKFWGSQYYSDSDEYDT